MNRLLKKETSLETLTADVVLDLKEVTDEGIIKGYGAVFGNTDDYGDVLVKGAFKKSLKQRPRVKMLRDHDPSKVIGVWDTISEDDKGLVVEGRLLTEVALARETHTLLKEKAIEGLSIGYRTINATAGKNGERMLKEVDLWEVSVVTFPANKDATVTQIKGIETVRQFEEFLRKHGFSKKQARDIASYGFVEGVGGRWDAGDGQDAARREAEAKHGELEDLAASLSKLKEMIHG